MWAYECWIIKQFSKINKKFYASKMQEEKLYGLPSHESFAHNFCIIYEKNRFSLGSKMTN